MPGIDFISTDYRDLDTMLGGGLMRGQLVLLAGVSGVGKSSLAGDIALTVSLSSGLPVLYISTETTAAMLALRWLCALSGHPLRDVLAYEAGERPDGAGAIEAAGRSLHRIAGETGLCSLTRHSTLQAIRKEAITWCRNAAHAGLVVIDGLATMELPPYGADAYSAVARSLKALAIETDVPVLLTTHWPQEMLRMNKRPLPSDRPDMDDVIAAADLLLFLHREDAYSPDGEAELIIAKHRNGPTGTVRLRHELSRFRFQTLPAEVA